MLTGSNAVSTLKQERENIRKITFTSNPKSRRKKTRNRSVRNTCEALVDSFFPMTKVPYNVMRMRLMNKFDRVNRKTVLSYLGRPKKRQVEKVEHTIQYQTSGVTRMKVHTFVHKLPAKKGYLEIFGLAELHNNQQTGESWFKLNHTIQTELPISPLINPPYESCALKESDAEFKDALAYAKLQNGSRTFSLPLNTAQVDGKPKSKVDYLKPKLYVKKTEIERESLRGRENRSSESKLSARERRVLGLEGC